MTGQPTWVVHVGVIADKWLSQSPAFYCSKIGRTNIMRSDNLTEAVEPLLAGIERREPRCRICRDEAVRVLVNQLLDWHGAPIILGGGKTHAVTYADILRDLEPLNEGRDKRNRITYDSLWVSTPSGITTSPG